MGLREILVHATRWSSHDYGTPEPGASPATVVRVYVRARHDWEVRARHPFATDESRRAELASIKAAFCTPRSASRESGLSWGSAPEWQPDHLEVLSEDLAVSETAVVRTRELPFYVAGGPTVPMDFRYTLRRSEDRWRIDTRSTTGLDGEEIVE